MRFRVSHLLLLAVVVAICAYAISNPNTAVASWMQFFAWAFYATLAIRAISKPGRERLILICAFVAGLSHLTLSYWMNYTLPPLMQLSDLLDGVIPLQTGDDFYYFSIIGEICVSFLISFVGGLIGVYWTRQMNEKAKI